MLDELRITDPSVADPLSSSRGARFLAPYFARPRSIAEAVDYLDEPMSKVHYWTRKWHSLGLLEVAERRKRAGREILFYRAIARRFVIPANLLSQTLLERQLDSINQVLLRSVRAAIPGLSVGADMNVWQPSGRRGITMDRTVNPADEDGQSMHSSFTLMLTDDEARALGEDLRALQERWIAVGGNDDRVRTGRGLGKHMVVVASVPVVPG